jgi:hypothetical protein
MQIFCLVFSSRQPFMIMLMMPFTPPVVQHQFIQAYANLIRRNGIVRENRLENAHEKKRHPKMPFQFPWIPPQMHHGDLATILRGLNLR